MGYPPPYFLRLRIFAKLASYFYHKLSKLEPVYDNCPVRCLAPEKDKPNGCPECSYTILFNQFKKDYYKLLSKDFTEKLIEGGFNPTEAKTEANKLAKEDWTFEEMQADYRIYCDLEQLAGAETEASIGGVNPLWNIRTELGISIIREERYKVRRELDKKRKDELEAERKAQEIRLRRPV